MADAEFEAGEGTANQLPRGEATAVNEGTTVEPPEPLNVDMGTALQPEDTPEPVEEEDPLGPDDLADSSDFIGEGYVPLDPDEEYLVGPTGRPDEDQAVGAQYPAPLSPRLKASLSDMQAAASQPGASPELIALVALLLRSLD